MAKPKFTRQFTPDDPIWELSQVDGDWGLPLDDREFNMIRDLARTHAGIEIADYKKNMVRRRISKRLKARNFDSHAGYCAFLSTPEGKNEIQPLINALTTNKTEFFREDHHFQHLASTVIPKLLAAQDTRPSSRLRIWSAGCSTGQEPYSIAMTLSNAIPGIASWDAKVLATDIDTDVLNIASKGVYGSEAAGSIPADFQRKFLEKSDESGDHFQMGRAVRSLLTFKQLNLHGPWPMKGPFDLIFCRNVVIYFDKPSQRQLFDRFAGILGKGGLLYCGHSESLFGICSRFRPIGKSVYEKIS